MWSAPGMSELLVILVIVLVLFGGGKIAGLGRSLGTAISEFKEAVKGEPEKKASARDDEENKPAE